MLNDDMKHALKTLLVRFSELRSDMNNVNVQVLEIMGSENEADRMRAFLPEIIKVAGPSADAIKTFLLGVDWEAEGNDVELVHELMSGNPVEVPEDLKEDVQGFLENLKGSEAEMISRFGQDPLMACLAKLGLVEEFTQNLELLEHVDAMAAALPEGLEEANAQPQ